jgi:hypothetical protein
MKELDLDLLVERLLEGEVLTSDERAALERSPAHRTRVQEARNLQQALDRASASEHADLFREAEALEDWPGRAEFHRRLQDLMGQARGPRRRRRAPWLVLLAAAAAVLIFFLQRGARAPAVPPAVDDVFVGIAPIDGLAPLGEVERFERFQWRYELSPGGRFELLVWDAAAPDDALPLVQVELERSEWIPGPDVPWPAAIRWQVRAYGATSLEAAAEGRARRRGP